MLRKIRALYHHIILQRENPKRIAKGIAIGAFTAFSPFIGFHTLMCIGISLILKASKSASILGSLICNPITFPIIIFIDYKVGVILLKFFKISFTPFSYSDLKEMNILKAGIEILIPSLVGSILLGLIAAFISYYFSFRYFKKIFELHIDEIDET